MRLARRIRRLPTAILRIVALLVMVPVLAHAHAGHDHAGGHDAGHVRGIGAALGAVANGVASAQQIEVEKVQAAKDRADPSDCLGCPGCCGHVFAAAPDHDGDLGDWPAARRVAMGPDSARPSAMPEAIPEPPRPFA